MICADCLPDAITAVMAENDDWCVLRARSQLSVDPSYVPPNDYLYAYLLPNDCSDFQQDGVEAIDAPSNGASLTTPPGSKSSYPWSREGIWLLTNATLVYLRYQRNPVNEDAVTLPDWFLHAVHDQLAVNLCMPMRQNPSLLRYLEKSADRSLRNAIANDDKMKQTAVGSDVRGYGYYEETRGGGGTCDHDPTGQGRW